MKLEQVQVGDMVRVHPGRSIDGSKGELIATVVRVTATQFTLVTTDRLETGGNLISLGNFLKRGGTKVGDSDTWNRGQWAEPLNAEGLERWAEQELAYRKSAHGSKNYRATLRRRIQDAVASLDVDGLERLDCLASQELARQREGRGE